MNYLIIFSYFLVFSPYALAQDYVSVEEFCRKLDVYKPSADLNYKPGVDVHGNAVVHPNLNGPVKFYVAPIDIPVQIDLVDRLGLAPVEPGLQLEPVVAYLRVYEDGRVEYNGQDISERTFYMCENRDLIEVETKDLEGDE